MTEITFAVPSLRLHDMLCIFNMSRSTLYRRMESKPDFPRPYTDRGETKLWRRDEVTEYLVRTLGNDAHQLVAHCLTKLREELREKKSTSAIKGHKNRRLIT